MKHLPIPARITDEELIDGFEKATLPAECFHHENHVRAAFLYLSRYPTLEALRRFSEALRRFAAAQGKAQRYHETITWAYFFLIHEQRARAGQSQGWEEFARHNADLLNWKEGILRRYYRDETLASDLARSVFVLPDRRS